MELDKGAREIIRTLEDAGFSAYAVGGCVRDYLLGQIPKDIDITTSATPEMVKELFPKTFDTGIEHGTVTVLWYGTGYEVTTFRTEGKYSDHRRPDHVEFSRSLEEDLSRRDFTINAMAYNDTEGLVDIFGGMDDIDKKIIRCVGNAKERFTEDALRLLRAVRFAAQLGYEIESETYEAIKELAPTLSKISAERIQAELNKILLSDNPAMLKTAYKLGLTKEFLPEIDKCFETEQHNPHHCYSVGDHIIKSVENIEKTKALRLSMLLHDIAKPVCLTTDEKGIDHFHGHQLKSADMSKEILRRLKYDNDTIDMVYKFVRYHDERLDEGTKIMRRAMNRIGVEAFPDIFKVWEADLLAQSDYQREEKFARLKKNKEAYEEVIAQNECVSLKNLAVSGKDLIEKGIPSGPAIGELLNKMLDEVIENPEANDKEYLLNKYTK